MSVRNIYYVGLGRGILNGGTAISSAPAWSDAGSVSEVAEVWPGPLLVKGPRSAETNGGQLTSQRNLLAWERSPANGNDPRLVGPVGDSQRCRGGCGAVARLLPLECRHGRLGEYRLSG